MSREQIEALQTMVDDSSRIVFFGGAGVSTESGIPDFRSVDGLYHLKYDYPPETILSHSFYFRKREEFYRFYRDKILTVSIRRQGAELCWSFMAASLGTTVRSAESSMALM